MVRNHHHHHHHYIYLASSFSQSATFYDKKFYAKLKQSVGKICTLCTVYTQNSQSTFKENARQH